MPENERELVVPVLEEEVHVDTKPVLTGGVRVTKSFETHEELLEQELRKGHAEVERVQVSRVVDGPQQPYRSGDLLIIPVASETIQGCEKVWVVTEEIRVRQVHESESVQHRVKLGKEHVRVERLDANGNVVSSEGPVETPAVQPAVQPRRSIVSRGKTAEPAGAQRKVLSTSKSMLRKTPPKEQL